jgi:hypothetical protein
VSWSSGEAIIFRQVWRGRPWVAIPVFVVSDEPGLLATYLPERAPIRLAVGDWPGGEHPWANRGHWQGHGTLMLRRPRDRYSVWVFWRGEKREFSCWYANFERPYSRSTIGIDTLDHELDMLSRNGVTWERKDEEGVERCVTEGRFDAHEAERIRADAAAFEATYEREGPWWDLSWADWQPPPGLSSPPSLAEGWEQVPAA